MRKGRDTYMHEAGRCCRDCVLTWTQATSLTSTLVTEEGSANMDQGTDARGPTKDRGYAGPFNRDEGDQRGDCCERLEGNSSLLRM